MNSSHDQMLLLNDIILFCNEVRDVGDNINSLLSIWQARILYDQTRIHLINVLNS